MSAKKDETRARVKAMREEQARADRRRERTMRFGIIGAVLAGIAIVVAAVVLTGGDDDTVAGEVPANVTESGGIPSEESNADAPVTMDIWLDFLCPACKSFEETSGPAVDEMAASGDVNVVYHPVSFTGRNFSNRATNAWICASEQDLGDEFRLAAFANQQNWEPAALKELGSSIGVGGDFNQCIDNAPYTDWASAANTQAQEENISGTPTIKINGEEVPSDQWSPQGLQAAVDAAGAGGGDATTTEPTPSATDGS